MTSLFLVFFSSNNNFPFLLAFVRSFVNCYASWKKLWPCNFGLGCCIFRPVNRCTTAWSKCAFLLVFLLFSSYKVNFLAYKIWVHPSYHIIVSSILRVYGCLYSIILRLWSVMYFNQLLLAARKVHVVYSNQLLNAAPLCTLYLITITWKPVRWS